MFRVQIDRYVYESQVLRYKFYFLPALTPQIPLFKTFRAKLKGFQML